MRLVSFLPDHSALVLSALYLVLDDSIVEAVHLIALCIVVLHLQDTELGSVAGSASPAPRSAQQPPHHLQYRLKIEE